MAQRNPLLPSLLQDPEDYFASSTSADTAASAAAAAASSPSATTSHCPNYLTQYFTIPDFSIDQKWNFVASYNAYNLAINYSKRGWTHYTAVTSKNNLYLGMLPCSSGFTLPAGITAVFSVCTYAELAGVGLNYTPLSPKYYYDRNIQHSLIICQDNTGDVEVEDVIENIELMHQHLSADPNNKIYLHCKAGCGRSAMICILYHAIFGSDDNELKPGNYDIDKVMAYLKSIRDQVNIENQLETARKILAIYMLKKIGNPPPLPAPIIYDTPQDYLASAEGKNAIRKLAAFKELAIYASLVKNSLARRLTTLKNSTPFRTSCIQDFFLGILLSEDGNWYPQFTYLEKLVKGKRNKQKSSPDRERRKELKEMFTQELSAHLIQLAETGKIRVMQSIPTSSASSADTPAAAAAATKYFTS